MIRKALLALVVINIVMLWAIVAFAQTHCDQRDTVVEVLGREYGEVIIARALSNGRMLEVLVNPETLTYTVIKTSPSGISCTMDAGTSWISIEPEKGPGL